jgi:hypothetical protein
LKPIKEYRYHTSKEAVDTNVSQKQETIDTKKKLPQKKRDSLTQKAITVSGLRSIDNLTNHNLSSVATGAPPMYDFYSKLQ